jgi:hypothetical protein
MLRHVSGRDRTCNPVIRSHILHAFAMLGASREWFRPFHDEHAFAFRAGIPVFQPVLGSARQARTLSFSLWNVRVHCSEGCPAPTNRPQEEAAETRYRSPKFLHIFCQLPVAARTGCGKGFGSDGVRYQAHNVRTATGAQRKLEALLRDVPALRLNT